MRTYEAMFLVDADNPDFDAACAPIRDVLGRAKAEVVSLKPWDERRLAYDISGRRRGLYVLTYFRAEPAELVTLQNEVQLDERILRALVLSADHLSEDAIRAETPATLARARKAAAEKQRAASEAAQTAKESDEHAKPDQTEEQAGSAAAEPAPRPRTRSRPRSRQEDSSDQGSETEDDPGRSHKKA
ncbi:MAG: hypothetical protein AMJ81_10835 [Phycisphaerae bacterium SM23_33]|nr:MAG: hypothetical protein AMJ81_10835 [Phycisphaerae bacterium SM23_33]